MGEHTPGKWELGDENNEHAEVCMGDVAVSLDRYSRNPGRCGVLVIDRDEMLANARLIAAAPELLEALKRALRWFDGDFPYGHEEAEREGATEAARAAIEKARGEG